MPGAVIQDQAAGCVDSFVLRCCSKPHVPPWLVCCSVLPPGPSATAPRGAAAMQCVMQPTCSALELRSRETAPGSESRSFLAGQAGAMWVKGEFPGAGPCGRGVEFVSKIPLSEFSMPCPTLCAHLSCVPSLE